jgi:TPR repeat protein
MTNAVARIALWLFSRPSVKRVAATILVIGALAPMIACDVAGPWSHKFYVGACPRPQIPVTDSPQFNDQQHEIHALREQGFNGDFFAQIELAHRYEGGRATDKNLEDPVESATWYALALANPTGYEHLAAHDVSNPSDHSRLIAHFDDCRAFERISAYNELNQLLSHMDGGEWQKVMDRVIYVLSTQGAPGFETLARMHDTAFGPFGEPLDNDEARYAMGYPNHGGLSGVLQLFPRNDIDAYLYNDLAAQTGDVGAYVLLKDFEHGGPQRTGYANFISTKVNRWVPPYEFYPPDAPASGVPHSDESQPRNDYQEAALSRIDELPFIHVADAMVYLGALPAPCDFANLHPQGVQALQAMLGRPQTGHLERIEKVRAIQLAAVNGSPRAQLVLAVMYSQGVGVPTDYARAFHWFQRAEEEGSPEAKYAISTYFSLGLAGVADQSKAQAVVQQLNAALAGFTPSADRLQAILARVNGAQHLPERESW